MGLTSFRRMTGWGLAGIVAAGVLAGAASVPKQARADRDGFYIRNQADVALTAVYVSPIFSKRWRDDRLAEDSLDPGGETWVAIDGVEGEGECFFDIRVEASDGQPYELWGIDLCSTRTVTVP